jgi:hypothetical protein
MSTSIQKASGLSLAEQSTESRVESIVDVVCRVFDEHDGMAPPVMNFERERSRLPNFDPHT